MNLGDLLTATVGVLEAESIPYMLTGSIASAFYGEPRATRDIDIVIDPTAVQLDRLITRLQELPAYVDEGAARSALRERSQFNAVVGDAKIDFVIRKARPFSNTEFERRRRVQLPGLAVDVVSAEDLVLVKLEWAAATDSDRQLRDVEGMVRSVGGELDRGYVDGWAAHLGVTRQWHQVLDGVAEE